MNLIDTWFHVEKEINGKSIAQAVRDINKATGLKVFTNKVYEWRDGNGRAPDLATRYMRIVVMRHAFFLSGINADILSESQIKTLAELMSSPPRKGGKNE